MKEPRFLQIEQVLELHEESINQYGGTHGLRDPGGLESAVMQPQNVFFYANGSLFDIAAAYAFHIAEAQAFLDGNKRTAATSALAFLGDNGVNIRFDSLPALHVAMIAIANRQLDKPGLAALLCKLASQ